MSFRLWLTDAHLTEKAVGRPAAFLLCLCGKGACVCSFVLLAWGVKNRFFKQHETAKLFKIMVMLEFAFCIFMTSKWQVSLLIHAGTESALRGLRTQQQYRDTLTKAVLHDLKV